MFNVHVRVNDAATGQPTPVRLRISGPDGRDYPPLGRIAEFAVGKNEDVGGQLLLGRERWYYIDGTCEVPLPAGVPLVFEATKGPEFERSRQEVTLGPGQMALRLTIKRWIDLREDRWFSGDARCHALTPHSALLEAMAEDLAVVQLLAAETLVPSQDGTVYTAVPNITAFSGQRPALERAGHLVAVNTFNTHPVLGSLALLHSHRAVFPLSFGGAEATDDWSLADWCDQCHRKKGLVVWADPFHHASQIAPEALADLILGRIDAIECTPANTSPREWYRAWSIGIRAPLAGASGKDSNRIALGAIRTFARLARGTPLDLAAWIEAVRAGRTYVTAGPLLHFSVNDQDAGAVLDLPVGERVWIKARLESFIPLASPLEVIVNGDTIVRIRSTAVEGGSAAATVEMQHEIAGPCWIAARCAGSPAAGAFAHSSPVFVRAGGRLPADSEVIRQYGEWLGHTVDWVDAVGRFEMTRRKEQLRALLEQARENLVNRLEGNRPC